MLSLFSPPPRKCFCVLPFVITELLIMNFQESSVRLHSSLCCFRAHSLWQLGTLGDVEAVASLQAKPSIAEAAAFNSYWYLPNDRFLSSELLSVLSLYLGGCQQSGSPALSFLQGTSPEFVAQFMLQIASTKESTSGRSASCLFSPYCRIILKPFRESWII